MNNDQVHRLYAAVGAGDRGTVEALLAPDVVLHVPGTHPGAGEVCGRAAVLRALAAGASTTTTEVLDVLTGRGHVAVYCRVRGEGGFNNPTLHLLRVQDDRVAEIWFHNRDQAHVDAFRTGVAA